MFSHSLAQNWSLKAEPESRLLQKTARPDRFLS
jgi:hypothetical protein